MRALLLALVVVLAAPAWAVEPDEMLDDPALEARARALTQEIRSKIHDRRTAKLYSILKCSRLI